MRFNQNLQNQVINSEHCNSIGNVNFAISIKFQVLCIKQLLLNVVEFNFLKLNFQTCPKFYTSKYLL